MFLSMPMTNQFSAIRCGSCPTLDSTSAADQVNKIDNTCQKQNRVNQRSTDMHQKTDKP